MKFAWIENGRIKDIAPGNPAEFYHPIVAAYYNTEVPEEASANDYFENGVWTKYVAPPPPEEIQEQPSV
jgi:hypothetical protein